MPAIISHEKIIKTAKYWVYGLTTSICGLSLYYAYFTKKMTLPTSFYTTTAIGCAKNGLSDLNDLPEGKIVSNALLTIHILNQSEHQVASLSQHRAAPGIHRTLKAFLSSDAQERTAALAPFDYVVLCSRKGADIPSDFEDYKDALYTALSQEQPWPGLTKVPTKNQALLVYKIDHDRLR